MNLEYTVTPLFSTPVFQVNVGEVPKEALDYASTTEYEQRYLGNGWYSADKYILKQEELAGVATRIEFAIYKYAHEVLKVSSNVSFEVTNSWTVKHEKGDWALSHTHTNSVLSGVMYLQVNDSTGGIVFNKDISSQNLFPAALDLESDEWNLFNAKSWSFNPKNGDIFIFPSSAQHSVSPNQSEVTRYSLAFNAFPRGVIGQKEFELAIK